MVYSLSAEALIKDVKNRNRRQQIISRLNKEKGKSVAEDIFPKLTESFEGSHFIKDQLPDNFSSQGIFCRTDFRHGEESDGRLQTKPRSCLPEIVRTL